MKRHNVKQSIAADGRHYAEAMVRGFVGNSPSKRWCFLFHIVMHQSIESPGGGGGGGGGWEGAGIVHRPSALFCIVPIPRGTFFCH